MAAKTSTKKEPPIEEKIESILAYIRGIINEGTGKGSTTSETQSLIIVAHWIATLKPGEKLNTRLFSISSTGLKSSCLRWLFGDNRWDDLKFVHYVANKLITTLTVLASPSIGVSEQKTTIAGGVKLPVRENMEETETMGKNIVKALLGLVNGVINMKTSYTEDRVLLSMMDELIDSTVLTKLEAVKKTHPSLFSSEEFRYQRVQTAQSVKKTTAVV